MFLYSERNKIRKIIIENFYFFWNILKSKRIKPQDKCIYIDIRDLFVNRYLYVFIKCFQLNGYTTYLPKDRKMISDLSKKKGEFRYGSWILQEKIKFGKPKSSSLILTRTQLSNYYFGSANNSNEFHVPMCEYPGFYFYGVENRIVDKNFSRKKSVFMSGNIDSKYYREITKSEIFDVLSRREVADFVMNQPYYFNVNTRDELNNFIISNIDSKVIIIDTKEEKFGISFKELKNILVEFNFYLALPGIFIPQSHNVIEAMSMGCIPVIHKNYATLFTPHLIHMENAIIYYNLKELDIQLSKLSYLQDNIIDSMKINVLEYYKNYLSPESIVNIIENNNFSRIFIQAENKSLEFFNRNFS